MTSTPRTGSRAWSTVKGCGLRWPGSTPCTWIRGRRCWKCGAGLATLELARRGYAVHSTDSSTDVVALTSRRIAEAGLGDVVTVSFADVHDLPHDAGSFDLVLALGVLPWLHSPQRALGQLARVLAPGGHAILSADNRLRLNGIVEPAESPLSPRRSTRGAPEGCFAEVPGREPPCACTPPHGSTAGSRRPGSSLTAGPPLGSGRSRSSGGPSFPTAPPSASTTASITSPSVGSPVCAAMGGTTSSRPAGRARDDPRRLRPIRRQ